MKILITALFLGLSVFLTSYSQDNSTPPPSTTIQTTAGEVCPVSGEALEEGKSVDFVYLGTTYKFCCESCVAKFKKEPFDYIKGELMCPVMGEAASKEYSVEYNGVKYYVCCPPCIKKFNKNPEEYLKGEKKEDHK